MTLQIVPRQSHRVNNRGEREFELKLIGSETESPDTEEEKICYMLLWKKNNIFHILLNPHQLLKIFFTFLS